MSVGFGYRVYRNYDPRAAIVKKAAQQIVSRTAAPDPLFDIALRLEEIALSDDYFIDFDFTQTPATPDDLAAVPGDDAHTAAPAGVLRPHRAAYFDVGR